MSELGTEVQAVETTIKGWQLNGWVAVAAVAVANFIGVFLHI